jgi:hypothetical protein
LSHPSSTKRFATSSVSGLLIMSSIVGLMSSIVGVQSHPLGLLAYSLSRCLRECYGASLLRLLILSTCLVGHGSATGILGLLGPRVFHLGGCTSLLAVPVI